MRDRPIGAVHCQVATGVDVAQHDAVGAIGQCDVPARGVDDTCEIVGGRSQRDVATRLQIGRTRQHRQATA